MSMRFETLTGMRKYLNDLLAGKRAFTGDTFVTTDCSCDVNEVLNRELNFVQFNTPICKGSIRFCDCGGSFWLDSVVLDD